MCDGYYSSFPKRQEAQAFRAIKSTPEAPSLIIAFIKLNIIFSIFLNPIVNIKTLFTLLPYSIYKL